MFEAHYILAVSTTSTTPSKQPDMFKSDLPRVLPRRAMGGWDRRNYGMGAGPPG